MLKPSIIFCCRQNLSSVAGYIHGHWQIIVGTSFLIILNRSFLLLGDGEYRPGDWTLAELARTQKQAGDCVLR